MDPTTHDSAAFATTDATRGPDSRELFEILVREHEPRLRAWVSALVRDGAAVDDLVQESFLVAWRNLHRFDHSLPFGPWLRGIGRRLCLAHHRRNGQSKLAYQSADVVEELGNLFRKLDESNAESFDQELGSLQVCFEKLPEHQQRILTLHYDEQLGCGDIATVVGRSREAVKKVLQRSRAWLGDCIEQRLDALGGRA